MKPHFPLPLFAALVLQGFMISGLQAQITTDNSPTPEELVSFLVGPDVQVSNVSFSGALSQRGTFLNNNSNLTISEGIVLSSGDISLMIGPNDNTSAGLNVNGVGNADLDNLSGQTTFDAAILEFDFIATGDSLTFNYSFASEEYNEFVNANVNDVFGLFLDGPGIAGPFTNQSINLAIVPETGGTPVSINTVNNDVNPNYYFDNEATSVANETQMDGFTVTLEAGTVLQCGETYHIRLCIADGGDGIYDSVVLLEAGSFSAGSVDLNANAVPLTAEGLDDIVPYQDALGLPSVFSYPNGESFPYGDWTADNNLLVEIDGQSLSVDAVVIEGCNDAQFTVIRPEIEIDLLDTLYLDLGGSAFIGLDYNESFNQVIMVPGQISSDITLGVNDDGVSEGVEFVEITFQYVNGCGETVITSSRVVILDPLPVEAIPSVLSCLDDDGMQTVGYDEITGYGPFEYIWDGNFLDNASLDSSEWVTSLDSLFDMTNGQGQLDFSRTIELVVTDQCEKSFDFEQTILHPVIKGTELCLDDRQPFPMFNSAIPIRDLLLNGQSVLDDETLNDTLIFEKTPIGNLWRLEGIESSSHRWDGSLTMVDSCGFETSALIRIRNCEVPNVFTPNNDSNNDSFRIRGLDGFLGSQLLIYNRYGTMVFSRETANDLEFELVWNGDYPNGNPAPSGHYQWVLLRSDGVQDRGELTLVR